MILAIILGVVAEGAAAIWALRWALPKSNKIFFSVFAGDALVRLLGLALATWWLGAQHVAFAGPLLTLAFGYVAMSLIQIPFLYKAH